MTSTDSAAVGSEAGRRVLRVAHLIHCLGPGGAEDVLTDLAVAAPHAGLDVLVVGLSPSTDNVNARRLRGAGVPVLELGLPRWDPRAVPRAVRALRQYEVDVIHTHLKHADLIGAAAGLRLGVPVVSTLHVIEDAPRTRMQRFKRTAGLVGRRRFAARTIALSRSQLDWYTALAGTDRGVVVLPNGVADPPAVEPAESARVRTEWGVPADGLLIASASLMRPEKGHDLLLDAVASLPTELPIAVALAGDGPLRPGLEERVACDPRLRDRVRFLGYRDDVPALLAAADLVLHTSRADALPTTLIHALSVGTPVIATDVGGIPDIVGHRVAGLLAPTDPEAIAAAVVELVQDASLRALLGKAGRERFVERFEATGWVRRLRAVYESALRSEVAPRGAEVQHVR
ncbi:glycosyltransferase [Pseudonocardia nigra]|uniref:glycosyltransferase n=1 Tax=Pseudonocardia nigra TaxID=1921578 RepID=UPI001C5D0198|nr:glycosyltransferase [Pseudonocardia nigra]